MAIICGNFPATFLICKSCCCNKGLNKPVGTPRAKKPRLTHSLWPCCVPCPCIVGVQPPQRTLTCRQACQCPGGSTSRHSGLCVVSPDAHTTHEGRSGGIRIDENAVPNCEHAYRGAHRGLRWIGVLRRPSCVGRGCCSLLQNVRGPTTHCGGMAPLAAASPCPTLRHL